MNYCFNVLRSGHLLYFVNDFKYGLKDLISLIIQCVNHERFAASWGIKCSLPLQQLLILEMKLKNSISDRRGFAEFVIFLVLQCFVESVGLKASGQPLILISADGFRWDYFNNANLTPNLHFIARTGVQAKFIRSAFTTTTYPNHYTMVTGLYPESHGIVSNYMYDPKFKARFNIKTIDPSWWKAEPLWTTNQEQGGKSGVIYWPGYHVKIQGHSPLLSVDTPSANTDIGNATGKIYSYKKRVDTALKWLEMKKPPNLIALYFEEPDESGHEFGPESKKLWKVIKRVDSTVGYLIHGLHSRNLLNRVNIIVTSDHGMTTISSKRQIYLDNYVDPKTYDIWDASTNFMINPRKGKLDYVYQSLQRVPHLKAYRKKDIPVEFHYKHSRRITPILAMPNQGWTINTTKTHLGFSGQWEHGNHGFSNQEMDMHALFVARGPAFRTGYKAKPFDNVNLYSLLCKVLGVRPRANNGTLKATKCMLKPAFLRESGSS